MLIVVASIVSPMLALSLASGLRPFSPLARVLIVSVGNFAVPALAGALVAYVASPVLRAAYLELRDVTRHVSWCASWYVLLALLLVPIGMGWGSEGFGLVAQLFVWPATALAAAIVTDVVLTKRAGALALLLLATLGARTALRAQVRWDTIQTTQGRCAVWAAIPGFSDWPRDATYNRCALERGLATRADNPEPPSPRLDRYGGGTYTVVVNADGSVDSLLTGAWTLVGEDDRFQTELLAAIRRWRFDAGVRDGAPVRSALRLVVATDVGNDTLPARLDWRYVAGAAEDSLIGTWIIESSGAALDATAAERVYEATLAQLRRQSVLLPNRNRRLCLLLAERDTAREARLSRHLARVLTVACSAMPVATADVRAEMRRDDERRRAWLRRPVSATPSAVDSVSLTALFAMNGAGAVDTVHTARHLLPRFGARAVRDSVRVCGGRMAFSEDEGAEHFVVYGDPAGRRLQLSDVRRSPPPASAPGTPTCGPQDVVLDELVAFLLGDLGAAATQPTALCFFSGSDCVRRYVLDPAQHTLTERADVRVRLGDLRGATATNNVFRLRVHADPAPDDLLLFLVLRRSGWRPLAHFLRRVDVDTWEYLVSHGDDLPEDTELFLYVVGR